MFDFILIRHYLRGALLLARFDPEGKRYFPTGRDACIDSFQAAWLLFPCYLMLVLFGMSDRYAEVPLVYYIVCHTIGYVLVWALFPLCLYWLRGFLEYGDRVWDGIILFNWSSLVVYLFLLPPQILIFAGLLPPEIMILVIVLWLYLNVYRGFVLKTGLEIEGIPATLLVVIYVGLYFLRDKVISAILLPAGGQAF